ncbi:MAG: hypothetical protein IKI11_03225 [Neisseriaceae bacterium]|nr:hypothetical protein [Neisseriaceae bacterium]
MKKYLFLLAMCCSYSAIASDFCYSSRGSDYVNQVKQSQFMTVNMGNYQYMVQNVDCRNNTLIIELKVDDDPSWEERRVMANNIRQQIDLTKMLCATREISQAAHQGLQKVVYHYFDRKGEIIMSLDATLNQCR